MKKVIRLFSNIIKEQEWLARQKGWKLIHTNGICYTFEESTLDYDYEYIFFNKSKKELDDIRNQLIDSDIELVCNSSSWALFRKDVAKGEIHVYNDNNIKYKMLMMKYRRYIALGTCFLCLGSSQNLLSLQGNGLSILAATLSYLCSAQYFFTSSSFKKYALKYDDVPMPKS